MINTTIVYTQVNKYWRKYWYLLPCGHLIEINNWKSTPKHILAECPHCKQIVMQSIRREVKRLLPIYEEVYDREFCTANGIKYPK